MKDRFLIGLALIAVAILGCVILSFDPATRAGIAVLGSELNIAGIVLFAVTVTLGSIAIGVKIWKMASSHTLRDGKGDQTVRAVIYKGTVVQLGSAEGIGLTELLQMQSQLVGQQQKTMQVVSTASTAIQRLVPLLEMYEDEDGEDVVDGTPRIEAPRDEYLNISDDYKPHANELLSGRKLIVGVAGSGKSNTTATFCEELGRLNVPMILADTENEYEPLCDPRWLPNGILASQATVNTDNAADFGRYVLEQNLQVILNLQSYELEEGAWVMVNLIAGLRSWQEARANESRIPFEFLLEEATTWLPQNVKESPLNGTEVFSRLQDAFFNDMVRKGRKRGLGLTVICQKIAEVDKRALQCDGKLLHRQTELNDLEKYAKMGITNEETISLKDGQGYFYSSKVSKVLMQVRVRHSQHGANTPGLSALRQHQQSRNSIEREQASGEFVSSAFIPPVKPFENISKFPEGPRKTVGRGVPETTKAAIVDLYQGGTKRTDIQGILDLNGDQYWMVKAVCDEYDRVKGVR